MTKLMNKKMFELLSQTSAQLNAPGLDMDLLRASFIMKDDCYLIDVLYNNIGNISISNSYDKTGYECNVNHIHFDSENSISVAILFSLLMMSRWSASIYSGKPLRHIISSDAGNCIYRCHVIRKDENWLTPDLESYEEPILVLDQLQEALLAYRG